jgi:hypothetical protein
MVVGSPQTGKHYTLARVLQPFGDPTGTNIANARLIAASPDGHAIAERLVAYLRDDFRIPDSADEGWIVDSLGHSLGGIYIDALAYLAKVAGQCVFAFQLGRGVL